MCETSFGIWCWPSRAHGRRLDAGSLRGRDWTLQCTQSLYRAEVPCYDPGQLGRHSEKSGRNLWTRVLCWTSRKVNVFRERHQPSNLRLFATDECKWLYSYLGARLYEERLFQERGLYPPSWGSAKKVDPCARANSVRTCSGCLASTELTQQSEPKCLYGVARVAGVKRG